MEGGLGHPLWTQASWLTSRTLSFPWIGDLSSCSPEVWEGGLWGRGTGLDGTAAAAELTQVRFGRARTRGEVWPLAQVPLN